MSTFDTCDCAADSLRRGDRPVIIAFQGQIGAGKTSRMRALGEYLTTEHGLSVAYAVEPVKTLQELTITSGTASFSNGGRTEHYYQNLFGAETTAQPLNLLEKLYEDAKQHALLFQLAMYSHRHAALQRALRQPGIDVILTDSDRLSDRVFAEIQMEAGNIDYIGAVLYNHVTLNSPAPTTDLHVFLSVSLSTAYRRIAHRNRIEEARISLEYLKQLDARQREYFGANRNPRLVPENERVLQIDANLDFKENTGWIDEIVSELQRVREAWRGSRKKSSVPRFAEKTPVC